MRPWPYERREDEAGEQERDAVDDEIAVFRNEFDWDDREACAFKRVGEAPQQAGQRQRQRTQVAAGGEQPHAGERERHTHHFAHGRFAPPAHTHVHEHHEQGDDREACAFKRVGEAPQQAGQRQRQRTQVAAGGEQPHAGERERHTHHFAHGRFAPPAHTHVHEHHEQVHRLQHGGRARIGPMDREQVRHLHKRHAGERGDKVHGVVTHSRERFAHRFGRTDRPTRQEDQPGEDLAHARHPHGAGVVLLHEDLGDRPVDAPQHAADERTGDAGHHAPRCLRHIRPRLGLVREFLCGITLFSARGPLEHLLHIALLLRHFIPCLTT